MLSTLPRPNTMETSPTRNLVRAYLPWLAGAALLLLYLIRRYR